ncbi:PREDICTED: apoptosis-inducing factor 3 isoform X2 [Polistes dominula]|nr:PREDICTED: apoptosis-inducing factor 3 isoform X2 [Polistes dominula]XP_015176503.1 PREDICTED: apoptosis-inducing factor 3 isoform X2 [Polistes dominula]XP_015176504.1 PREDICTED: apoptosis-inducing factor 3 isoform X2 [Polistes dominula]
MSTNGEDKRKIHVCNQCNKEQGSCCCSCVPQKSDYIEDVVCKENDINENEMKVVTLGKNESKVLLVKQKGEIHAVGTKCTHYGAPLHTGALGDGIVRCPWHGACFNIKTGDIEDYPGLDSLPCYKVTIDEEGLVRVKARVKDLEVNKRVKDMCEYDAKNPKTTLIIGGGPSAATCAESLRQEGFTGKIILICKENTLPYDRVKVSKVLNFDVNKFSLRQQSFYNDHNIETKLGREAIALDTNQNIVTLDNSETLKYDYLYLCTGSKARVPDLPGVHLENIFVLRNYNDSHAVHKLLHPDKHVVIYGLGFIGMEVASYCIDKCASVTVIGRGTVPLHDVFGTEIGNRVREEFETKGIKFIFNNNISKFIPKEGTDNTLGKVELSDGNILEADICIIGIGSTFYTDWLKKSTIKLLDNGAIIVDKYLKTNIENVFAGGDIAYAPVLGSDNISAAIGHYGLAHYHGKIAALNICNKEKALYSVPFFWTTLFGKSYRYAGYGKPDKVIIYGSLENLQYFAYYVKDGKIIAMSSVGADPVVSDFANLMAEKQVLMEDDIKSNPYGWMRNKPKDVETRFPLLHI